MSADVSHRWAPVRAIGVWVPWHLEFLQGQTVAERQANADRFVRLMGPRVQRMALHTGYTPVRVRVRVCPDLPTQSARGENLEDFVRSIDATPPTTRTEWGGGVVVVWGGRPNDDDRFGYRVAQTWFDAWRRGTGWRQNRGTE